MPWDLTLDRQALETLTSMKGIGPATASAILSFGDLDGACPFLSDEAMYAFGIVNSKGTLDYTLDSWITLREACDKKAEELNASGNGTAGVGGEAGDVQPSQNDENDDEGFHWTPALVERALWAASVNG